jgi:hypothetical protein
MLGARLAGTLSTDARARGYCGGVPGPRSVSEVVASGHAGARRVGGASSSCRSGWAGALRRPLARIGADRPAVVVGFGGIRYDPGARRLRTLCGCRGMIHEQNGVLGG